MTPEDDQQVSFNINYWRPVLAAAMTQMGKTLTDRMLEDLQKEDKLRVRSKMGFADDLTFLFLNNMLKYSIAKEIVYLSNLRTLDLSENALTGTIPDYIGDSLGRLTVLNLSKNRLTGTIPNTLCQLKLLMSLNLSDNYLTGGIPVAVGALSNLTLLSLSNNELSGELPETMADLSFLTSLILFENKFSGPIPEFIGDIQSLVYVYLDNNEFSGELPESLSRLTKLQYLYLSNNAGLCGCHPDMHQDCKVVIEGTKIHFGTLKMKQVDGIFDNILIALYIACGYLNLFLGLYAIVIFHRTGYVSSMALNITFFALTFIFGFFYSQGVRELGVVKLLVYNVLQAHIVIDGIDTIRTGHRHQVYGYVSYKQFDAVFRSIPSMVIQLLAIFFMATEHRSDGFDKTFLEGTVAVGIVETAITLTSIDDHSGESLYSIKFVLHVAYYFLELIVRVISMCIMFLTIHEFGLIPLLIELLVRGYFIHEEVPFAVLTDRIFKSFFSLGSDKFVNNLNLWFTGFLLISMEILIFLVYLNIYERPSLAELRKPGVATDITIVVCFFWFMKLALFGIIRYMFYGEDVVEFGYNVQPKVKKTDLEMQYVGDHDKYDQEMDGRKFLPPASGSQLQSESNQNRSMKSLGDEEDNEAFDAIHSEQQQQQQQQQQQFKVSSDRPPQPMINRPVSSSSIRKPIRVDIDSSSESSYEDNESSSSDELQNIVKVGGLSEYLDRKQLKRSGAKFSDRGSVISEGSIAVL